ncbi:hypothetical protein SEVIR_5G190200v4 [Setaria viridis]|uniref:UvrD-like helicase ATP-binding domain-containing protein n=1 Tax=Setaria viridis TaxID=4556 RepID=A0A4U6UFP4_SETVI|nr:uncharacterized protein LOC117855456 [Setaria viridis]TKW14788.1 hypothetical protein SEVIR_5G190200v2 [Setaria viridis]
MPGVMEEAEDLSDVVLSWSIQEILGGEQQVEKIPYEFNSVDHYFKSFIAPLVEETRSQLGISLEAIHKSPYSEIISMEAVGDSKLLYNMDVDVGYTSDNYVPRNGDILILSSFKPEVTEDLIYDGASLVMVVPTDVQHQKELRIKVLRDVVTEQNKTKFKYAVFATNIMTKLRIWNVIFSQKGMNNNFTIIKSMLSPKNMDGNSCGLCAMQVGDLMPYLIEKLRQTRLNQSQLHAVITIISAVRCKHSNLVKLIWGPPGTGKTKTVSTTLWALKSLKCRTLMCSPTNISVVGVCHQYLQALKDLNGHADTDGLPCSLGDIVLFGNKYKMDITEEVQEVLLDYRVNELVKCFSSSSGWKHRINSVLSLLENYNDPLCLLDFYKQFCAVANDVKECILNLWIHLPRKCFSSEVVGNILDLLHLLKTMCDLFSCEDFSYGCTKRRFYFLSAEKIGSSKPISFAKDWVEARFRCLEKLKFLQSSFDLPVDVGSCWIRNYCIHNATLIFCTVSSSYHLHNMETTPVDVLVIDEAAQVQECESVIPLRLHGLRHAILVGDDCQLQPIVQSRVCKEAGLGVSLFKRLALLGFEKHLLNIQYRMNPCISLFPNARFYDRMIIDSSNVKSPTYSKDYLDLPFGTYTFINIVDGKEEREFNGSSWWNMVEVAVVLQLIQSVFKSWQNTMGKITIGVVSPYNSQVNAIKARLGTKYDKCVNFNVRVTSIDGFQGEEDDIIILSTVRSNSKGNIGFLSDNHRTNVALTRARHCLWILGNANILSKSGTIWAALVHDAKQRECLINATDNAALAKLVLKVKAELDQLGGLLNFDSAAFCNTKWKIIFSSEFKNAFMKLKSAKLRWEVLQKLVGLGCGWRSKFMNVGMTDEFGLVKVYKVRDLYLVWTTDLEKGARLFQIIRIWDLVTLEHIERINQRLQNLFSMYSDDYMEHCRRVHMEGKWELPMVWRAGHDVTRLKKDCQVETQEAGDHVDVSHALDHSKVSESFLLMKFYSLSSGVAKHLLVAADGSKVDIPFELTEEENEIIQFPCSSFILGRSGTGKTTVLTMKLIQKEQQSLIAYQGLKFEEDDLSGMNDNNNHIALGDMKTEQDFVRQIFLTVSPKLCSVVKSHISKLKRFASDDLSVHPSSLPMYDINDELEEFNNIPDKFRNIPQKNYPIVITFRKFLMMLDGTMSTSFFDRFHGELRTCIEGGKLQYRTLQAYIETKEVDYEKFSHSYWPHFNAKLTKNLDPSTVFTQIISHIKGGRQAVKSSDGKLEKKDYIMFYDRRFPSLSAEIRDKIYDIYICYEKEKCIAREFDLSDFVNSLHSRLSTGGYNGDMLDFIYIDEVQDLSMNQIALLKYVCSNFKEGFIFAGDTAQTIARGIDFRFKDIRSFFYAEFLSKVKHEKELNLSDTFQLRQNFRTHCGILLLAQSIMDLLCYYFPMSVDKLNPETSLVHGEGPVLLESNNGENTLITIFRGNENQHRERINFGADQVILVRDDAAKEQVVGLVGNQALVLTILESKGLEFEDVLIYNLFSSSPLRNKWRVIYGYMKENGTIALPEKISYPKFDGNKHFLLCSELKLLYVAVTRTRQRLWICEDKNDSCHPIFDYWKKLRLVQVRQLNSLRSEEMEKKSSTDDWRLRGIKLFNERQFGMASMCFQKAGDEHREKWARAANHVANGGCLVSGNWWRAQKFFVEAAEIYDSIGMHEKAASCLIKSRDFKKAGLMYLEKCGSSRLEDAGECFAMAQSWLEAANAYFKAKCYTKCFSTCLKGELFDIGLKFVHQLEETASFDGPNSELNDTRNRYLEACASYYFHRKDIKHMMKFVKVFGSVDNVWEFLTSRTLFNEFLSFEVEMGNFSEAAGAAELIGSVLVWEDTINFGNMTQLIILHVIMNSLWNMHAKRRCHKGYVGKDQLLKKARDIVQRVSNFYCSASLEAGALFDPRKSLANLSKNLPAGSKKGILLVNLCAVRSILDIHLVFTSSVYNFESSPALENVKCLHDTLSSNQISPESLICIWNSWKSMVLEVLSQKVPSQTSRISLRQGRNRCRLNANVDDLHIKNYWTNELYTIGIRVLEKLESLATISSKQAVHPYVQGLIVLAIYETANFFTETKFSQPKKVGKSRDFFILDERLHNKKGKFKNFLVLSERLIFELVFLDSENETKFGLLHIFNSPAAIDLLVHSLNTNATLLNRRFACEQLRIVTTLLLLSGRLDDRMISSFMPYLNRNSPWEQFFQSLRSFLDGGSGGARLLLRLGSMLRPCSISITMWIFEVDYNSPVCYGYLMKWFSLWASSYIKSLFVEMVKKYLGGCQTSCQDLDLEYSSDVYKPEQWSVIALIKNLLLKRSILHKWIYKTSACICLPILLRLVTVMYMNSIIHHLGDVLEVSDFLLRHGVLNVLHQDFSEKIQHTIKMRSCTVSGLMTVFIDGLTAMGNHLALMGLPEGSIICNDLIACIVRVMELRTAEKHLQYR